MPLSRVALDQQIHRILRDRILAGTIASGAHLVQEDIAAEFGVSRIPVRDALRRLAGEGMLVPGRKGYRARAVTPVDVADSYALRQHLEGLVARRCASSRPRALLGELAELCAAMRANAEARRYAENIALDYAFHAALYRRSGSPVFEAAATSLWSGFAPNAAIWISGSRQDEAMHDALMQSVREHEAIAAAIGAGDEDGAERAVIAHIGRAWSAILERAGTEVDTRADRAPTHDAR